MEFNKRETDVICRALDRFIRTELGQVGGAFGSVSHHGLRDDPVTVAESAELRDLFGRAQLILTGDATGGPSVDHPRVSYHARSALAILAKIRDPAADVAADASPFNDRSLAQEAADAVGGGGWTLIYPRLSYWPTGIRRPSGDQASYDRAKMKFSCAGPNGLDALAALQAARNTVEGKRQTSRRKKADK